LDNNPAIDQDIVVIRKHPVQTMSNVKSTANAVGNRMVAALNTTFTATVVPPPYGRSKFYGILWKAFLIEIIFDGGAI
jgi:hypothetical protein